MRDSDTKTISNFLARMGMYIYPCDETNVVSFLVGYECGAQNDCNFTDLLSKKLHGKYSIKKYATGWRDQVQRYSEASGIDWMQAFHLLASEIVNDALNQ